MGFCSRAEAWLLIKAGEVTVAGKVCRDPERRMNPGDGVICVRGERVNAERKVYLMLNKPRGLVTTTADEKGRNTVYSCFQGQQLPRVFPVGRLDMASEGLLLFTNDTAWAARITDPATHVDKMYHVQVDTVPTEEMLVKMRAGVLSDGELLAVKSVQLLRRGEKNCWLEITLDEGRNRHIRRLMDALEISVFRLMRIAIGSLVLGNLEKGKTRLLTEAEVRSLS